MIIERIGRSELNRLKKLAKIGEIYESKINRLYHKNSMLKSYANKWKFYFYVSTIISITLLIVTNFNVF